MVGYVSGPLYTVAIIYSQIANAVMIETAISINNEQHAVPHENDHLRQALAISVVTMILGAVLVFCRMKPQYYKTFVVHESMQAYLTHRWDHHNTAVIGTGVDAVRADILT